MELPKSGPAYGWTHEMGSTPHAALDAQREPADGAPSGSRLSNAGLDRPDHKLEVREPTPPTRKVPVS